MAGHRSLGLAILAAIVVPTLSFVSQPIPASSLGISRHPSNAVRPSSPGLLNLQAAGWLSTKESQTSGYDSRHILLCRYAVKTLIGFLLSHRQMEACCLLYCMRNPTFTRGACCVSIVRQHKTLRSVAGRVASSSPGMKS